MRRAGKPGRGTRGRVERRVRAALASAGAAAAAPSPSSHEVELDEAGPPPWLPGADFAADLGGHTAFVAPQPAPDPATASVPRPPGLVQRLLSALPMRLDPGRRSTAAIGVAVVLAAVITLVWVLSARPHAVAVQSSAVERATATAVPSAADSLAPHPSPTTSAVNLLVVDVAGKVRHPGLYRLPTGARVDDAVKAAGGALAGVDLTTLNLAAKLSDGQQIAVGLPGAGGAPAGTGAGSSAGSGAAAGPVNLNTASLEQLDTLPGVGPVLAQHILDWRAAHGQFSTVDQLGEVSGIGSVKFAALRPLVTI